MAGCTLLQSLMVWSDKLAELDLLDSKVHQHCWLAKLKLREAKEHGLVDQVAEVKLSYFQQCWNITRSKVLLFVSQICYLGS